VHDIVASHISSVHGSPSPHEKGPMHSPPLQTSGVVQPLPSSHERLLFTCWQPMTESQPSVVHRLPSSHVRGVPTHAPPEQVSMTVHASPSVHGFVLAACTQPPAPQESFVHELPSSQPAETHAPAQHISLAPQSEARMHVVPTHAAVWHGAATHVAGVQLEY